ncbi:MAG: histidine phosphotransferase family protein [Pseudomonadota bacterium]
MDNAAAPAQNPSESSADAGSPEESDALSLSSLISSRVCHDLINPVGAIGSGLDVLDDPDTEETMRDAALDLIRSGAQKALALLTFARLAYGAAGGFGAQISLDDAKAAMQAVYDTLKPELAWNLAGGLAAKEQVKTLLILAHAAADCVPRGGVVAIEGEIGDFTITATGKRIYLQDDLVKALQGDGRGLTPKFTPALIAAQLVKSAGGEISAEATDEKAVMRARVKAHNQA